MVGIGYIIRAAVPPGTAPETVRFTDANVLDKLREIVGGSIEVVPGWNRMFGQDCVVFCNEDGKGLGLPFNPGADLLWKQILRRQNLDAGGDYLVGNIIVLIGDAEFMSAL